MNNSPKNREIKKKFIDREIIASQTKLVEELFKTDKSVELSQKIKNFFRHGVTLSDSEFNGSENEKNKKIESLNVEINNLKNEIKKLKDDLQKLDKSVAKPQVIHEWWLVTPFISKKLISRGEPVLEAFGNKWWGRCTTNHPMAKDEIFTEICEEMEIFEGQKNEWA